MDTQRLTSTEFRLVYARTGVVTEVTALGRVIGTWYPAGTEDNGRHEAALGVAAQGLADEVARLKRELAARPNVEPKTTNVSVPASNVRAPSKIHVGTATYDSVPWSDRPVTPAKK